MATVTRKEAIQILDAILPIVDASWDDFGGWSEIRAAVLHIEEQCNSEDDFYIDTDHLPCGEVRMIDGDEIEQIWTDSLIETTKEIHDLSELPSYIAIDWNKTAENCKVDGKGHHFNHYNGEEFEINNWWIFRNN